MIAKTTMSIYYEHWPYFLKKMSKHTFFYEMGKTSTFTYDNGGNNGIIDAKFPLYSDPGWTITLSNAHVEDIVNKLTHSKWQETQIIIVQMVTLISSDKQAVIIDTYKAELSKSWFNKLCTYSVTMIPQNAGCQFSCQHGV